MPTGLGSELVWYSPTHDATIGNDQTANNSDATNTAATRVSDTGHGGTHAYDFNGTSAFLDADTPGDFELTTATRNVTLWFKRNNNTAAEYLFSSINTGNSDWFYLRLDADGSLNFLADDGTNPLGSITSATGFDDNAWHFVRCKYAGPTNDMELWVDDVSEGTDTTNLDSSVDNTDEFLIGALWGSGGANNTPKRNFFGGRIADFRFHDGTLSDADATNLASEAGYEPGGAAPTQDNLTLLGVS